MSLDKNEVSPCILPKTGRGRLLTWRGMERQTEHSDFAVKGGGLPQFFSITLW